MPIGKGETASAIVISGRDVDHLVVMWIEKARVIHAVWMFVDEHPGFGWSLEDEIGGLLDVLIDGIPWSLFGVAVTDADIAGNAARARLPTQRSLSGIEVNVGRTFKYIWISADVLSYFRKFVI